MNTGLDSKSQSLWPQRMQRWLIVALLLFVPMAYIAYRLEAGNIYEIEDFSHREFYCILALNTVSLILAIGQRILSRKALPGFPALLAECVVTFYFFMRWLGTCYQRIRYFGTLQEEGFLLSWQKTQLRVTVLFGLLATGLAIIACGTLLWRTRNEAVRFLRTASGATVGKALLIMIALRFVVTGFVLLDLEYPILTLSGVNSYLSVLLFYKLPLPGALVGASILLILWGIGCFLLISAHGKGLRGFGVCSMAFLLIAECASIFVSMVISGTSYTPGPGLMLNIGYSTICLVLLLCASGTPRKDSEKAEPPRTAHGNDI